MTVPERIPFDIPDGEDIFTNESHLCAEMRYAKLSDEEIHSITTEQMTRAFKVGEIRPREHEDKYTVWRLQFRTTILRVLTPLAGKAQYSYIWVEAPEGPDSMANPIRRKDVADFVPALRSLLAKADSVSTP